MKITAVSAAAVALLAGNAAAFPANMDALLDPLAKAALLENRKRAIDPAAPQGVGALPLVPPPFDAKAQYVSNQGKYKFVPPGPGDQRGECPGLNAMANHGYLPHNGFATIQQLADGTRQAFGMAPDLAEFLAVYGAVVDGYLTGWSINGGPHIGIGGSHNNYEADSSPLKSDLSQYGDNGKLIISQYKQLYDMQPDPETANYNLEVLREFRGKRYYESIEKNPNFSYLPFSGIAVTQAAYTFIYRFMANKSAEYPEGILDKATLNSFMAIYGTDEKPIWKRGWERFPDNFYKRNQADEYSIPYFFTDIVYFGETQPEIIQVGCNQGRVNSFNEISPETLAEGADIAAKLAENPGCFAAQFGKAELPLVTGLGLDSPALAPLTKVLNKITADNNCADIGPINQQALLACPGFSFYGGPKADVAAGAIQS